jgi:polysaccharide biosynthesis protein PslH
MRSLLVTPHTPWPQLKGAAIRMSNVARGLAQLGDVDVLVIAEGRWEPRPIVPPDMPVGRVEMIMASSPPPSRIERMAWLAWGGLPRHFLRRDYAKARLTYDLWRTERYDVAWLHRIQSYVALGRDVTAPAIVDLDDLEDYKARARMVLETAGHRRARLGIRARLHRFVSSLEAKHDIRLLRNLHARIVRSSAAVVVCHQADQQRLAAKNGYVIPNAYERQLEPVGRVSVQHPPILTFPGTLTYHPNADGATYLVQEILPFLRKRIPDVRIRLVGEASDEAQGLNDPPRVVVTGLVQNIRTELARADVIVVPVRYGSGTRIKILEALAHRIPVVSTRAGAEGIDVTHGREILLADSPKDFAEACEGLLQNAALRERLMEDGQRLFLSKYSADRVREMVAALAARAAAGDDLQRSSVRRPTRVGQNSSV